MRPQKPDALADATPQKAAQELGANVVLSGTMMRNGDRLRVTYSVADLRSGSEKRDLIEGSTNDLFGVQDRVADSVASALALGGAVPAYSIDPQVSQQRFLEALGYMRRYDDAASVDKAIAILSSLGNSATVQSSLGRAYLYKFQLTHEPKWAEPARAASERALSADPQNVDVHITLGELKTKFKPVTQRMVLECGGNGRSFFTPTARGNQWTNGGAGCADWTGVRLSGVLKSAGVKSTAVFTGHYGSDRSLADASKDALSRGVPIKKAMDGNNLIVFAMNGQPLSNIHGGPTTRCAYQRRRYNVNRPDRLIRTSARDIFSLADTPTRQVHSNRPRRSPRRTTSSGQISAMQIAWCPVGQHKPRPHTIVQFSLLWQN